MKKLSPETCTYTLPSMRVEITGIDLNDCFETFEKRREEFQRKGVYITMNTPRLNEYYRQRREKKTA
ncbi:MAG TPA: hypothetical protein VMC80_03170 [Patescibacteria group bacterium]|nr:hypothetical protein [Patescibacteria group bacterium]